MTVGLRAGNRLLTGQRRDNGLWTCPGGHWDQGETLTDAAIREVREEAGIEVPPEALTLVRAEKVTSHRTGKAFTVYAFVADVKQTEASAQNDPDKEITEWKWVELSKETPELQPKARHAKEDFIVQHFGCWNVSRETMSLTEKRLMWISDEQTEDNSGKAQREIRA